MHGKVAFLGVGDASYYSRLFMYLLLFFFLVFMMSILLQVFFSSLSTTTTKLWNSLYTRPPKATEVTVGRYG